MKAKTSDVWVKEMFEAIFKRSNVKSSIQSLSWMPEVFPSSAAMEKRKDRSAKVLVGEGLLFSSAASRPTYAGFKEKKASVSKQTFRKGFSGLMELRKRTTRIGFN